MLTSEVYTPQEAIEEIDENIEDLVDEANELKEGTEIHQTIRSRIDRLKYFRNGLEWAQEEWSKDVEIELGALTAGEKALMHREVPDNAVQDEVKLWYAAAATSRAPYVSEYLSDTFDQVVDLHPAFVDWVEATANGLAVFGGPEGNADRSST